MTTKQLESTTIFQNAIDTVFDYKTHTATYESARAAVQAYADAEGLTYERATELVMEIVRCY